ncbi:hypothetical protein BY996DRAFT_8471822 [Phakopsora pachyrhizi]|nr:hypothetical protein BY996DRAFT_8471822 [Phakopsora pachyrhizi]
MTLNGEKVDKKGAESNQLRDIKSTICPLDQQITTLIGKIKNLKSKVRKKLGNQASCLSSISSLQKDQDSLKTRLAKLEKLCQKLELDLDSCSTTQTTTIDGRRIEMIEYV